MTESGLTPAGLGPGEAPADSIQALTEEIERTREDVGETVAALAAKADIMARTRAKTSEVAGRLRDTAGRRKNRWLSLSSAGLSSRWQRAWSCSPGALIARRRWKRKPAPLVSPWLAAGKRSAEKCGDRGT